MTIRICHLWHDALNWNGSQGNLTCLKKRLEWRNIPVEIKKVPVGGALDVSEIDLIYIGAGKAYENHTLLRDVAAKAPLLREYCQNGGALLAVCEGFELLGQAVVLPDGTTQAGLGILDMKTIYDKNRLTGNAAINTADGTAVYFENHAGRVYPNDDIPPLGQILKGSGNNGEDHRAGVRHGNVYGCQAHGPLLPKNPQLADAILRAAIDRRHPEITLAPLDDTMELEAQKTMLDRL